MPRAIVLGAGMVGSVMAADLVADRAWEVTLADRSDGALRRARERLGKGLSTREADLGDPAAVARIVAPYDIVLGALPSAIGFAALRSVIEAGKSCADISFMAEDALALDALAQQRGVTAVVDCGIAPGLSNMLAGRAAAELAECQRIDIAVGGVPAEPRPPFHYKAAFAPGDVLEEYTRPARVMRGGRVVIVEALSEVEPIQFAESHGTPLRLPLEAFNTDGLRSLLSTLDVPEMSEKTIRYAGHAALMKIFRETGLFDLDPVRVGVASVRPRDVTAAVLFPRWTYGPGEEDLTLLRVVAEGIAPDDARTRLTWEMVDRYDRKSASTSMARTTAFPAVAAARLIAEGRIKGPGVIPPERIGADAMLLDRVLGDLERRGVRVRAKREALPAETGRARPAGRG